MNQHSPLRTRGSLLERAAELYGFGVPTPPRPAADTAVTSAPDPVVESPPPVLEAVAPAPAPEMESPQVGRVIASRCSVVDRERLRAGGFIEPEGAVTAIAEEFRIVKRQLLLGATGKAAIPEDKRNTILVCSAHPDEGKTFCAVNLALSLAGERDTEVLLVDADFPKPEILSILGLEDGPGLVDALADPGVDPESLVIRTDVRGLSVLPAGRSVNNVTELLASDATRHLLDRLGRGQPRRIILFDSPPALMASPASVLATHAGQLVVVVRADRTTEASLREAVALLSGCDSISLLLNGAGFAANGRRFGAYYGYGQ